MALAQIVGNFTRILLHKFVLCASDIQLRVCSWWGNPMPGTDDPDSSLTRWFCFDWVGAVLIFQFKQTRYDSIPIPGVFHANDTNICYLPKSANPGGRIRMWCVISPIRVSSHNCLAESDYEQIVFCGFLRNDESAQSGPTARVSRRERSEAASATAACWAAQFGATTKWLTSGSSYDFL